MRKSSIFLGLLLIFSLINCSEILAQDASQTYTGRGSNGEYVLPAVLAVECKVKVSDDDASAKLRDCLQRIVKDKSGDNAMEADRLKELWVDILTESDLGALEVALQAKMYAADYDDDVVKDFEKNMADSKPSIPGSSGSGAGAKSGDVRGDWQNIAEADKFIAGYANEHLNNLVATAIMQKALKSLNGMDKSYFEETSAEK